MSFLIVDNVSDLALYDDNTAEVILVKDIERTSGNPFKWKPSGTANDGTIYNGLTGVWEMMFESPVNVKWFGAKGDYDPDSDTGTNDYDAINNAIHFCKTNNHKEIFIPSGNYRIDSYFQEIRQQTSTSILLDLKGILIKGEGKTTIITGRSAAGFDVFQLNAVKNLAIENLSITSLKTTSSTDQGCNGISMTNGTSNIRIINVHIYDLPYVVKVDYVDGGKAFSIQQGSYGGQGVTDVHIEACSTKNVPMSFNIDCDPTNGFVPNGIRVLNNIFEALYNAVSISLSYSVNHNQKLNVNIINNVIINSQVSFVWARGSGVNFSSNKIIANSSSIQKIAPLLDNEIYAAVIAGASYGNFSENYCYCLGFDNAIKLGGLITDMYCEDINISSNSFVGGYNTGISLVNNSVRKMNIVNNHFSGVTNAIYPDAIFNPALKNIVIREDHISIKNVNVEGQINLMESNGYESYVKAFKNVYAFAVQQTGASIPSFRIFECLSNSGTTMFGIRNDGGFVAAVDSSGIGTTYAGKIPVYNDTGTIIGYLPLYNT